MQPFQFNLQPAPPAYPSAGFAAFAQGMGNAADITAQSGTRFNALSQVARDFMLQRNQRALQERELQAREAYQNAWLAIQREQMKERMGYQKDANEIARRNVEARELGLTLQERRDAIAQDRAAREREVLEMNQLNADRLAAQARLRMMGVQGDATPETILGRIKDPAQRGQTEAELRSIFRSIRGPGEQRQPGPMDAVARGEEEGRLRAQYRAQRAAQGGAGAQQPTAPAPSAGGDTGATQGASGSRPTLAEITAAVAEETKAKGWTVEQARAELRRRAAAAGYK